MLVYLSHGRCRGSSAVPSLTVTNFGLTGVPERCYYVACAYEGLLLVLSHLLFYGKTPPHEILERLIPRQRIQRHSLMICVPADPPVALLGPGSCPHPPSKADLLHRTGTSLDLI